MSARFRYGDGNKIRHGQNGIALDKIAEEIEAQDSQWLNITPYHAQTIPELADYHKHPFDRLLII
ncbi:hypothetical protein METHB2_110049 [Candidatus Methylobacter favarea]|uniref:Uncharacterized protein n=1 Tax=Candidatus Methylobacter favarea TaxID=2707345 RepID=A0A8S0WM75_9GAMM|nr:hypothetical protein METHB2_110049 [Candidatus Methylobacter favarea]